MIRRIAIVVIAALVAVAVGVWTVGMLLPVAHLASGTRVLPDPGDEVYRLVSDVERYPSWWSYVARVDVLPRDADGRPTFRQHSSDGSIVMHIVEQHPPTRFVTQIADPTQPFGGTWTFDIAPDGDSTRLTITERGEVYSPVFRFVSRFVVGYTQTIESFLDAAERVSRARRARATSRP